jgi:hypothetical protein
MPFDTVAFSGRVVSSNASLLAPQPKPCDHLVVLSAVPSNVSSKESVQVLPAGWAGGVPRREQEQQEGRQVVVKRFFHKSMGLR